MPTIEDRKRPALATVEDLPPRKRQAVNGADSSAIIATPTESPSTEMREETWIDKFTKGAIFREMQEHSRKRALAEARVETLTDRLAQHDDRLRLVEKWWQQLVEELDLLYSSTIPAVPGAPIFQSRLDFADLTDFRHYLENWGDEVRSKAKDLISQLASSRGASVSADVGAWESKVVRLLAVQKELMVKLDGLASEKERLDGELNAATLRYLKSEKRLDRARSTQVKELEQQATSSSARPQSDPADNVTGVASAEAVAKCQEANAVTAKHREQLETALAEIKALTEQNSELRVRREAPPVTDEPPRHTETLKQLRAHCDELVRRINHLEMAHRQAREECDKLSSERTDFKTRVERDANIVTQDLETDIMAKDQDLARIRVQRDELSHEVGQRKASQDEHRRALDEMKAYVEEREHRIAALEAAVQQWKPGDDSSGSADTSPVQTEELPHDQLVAKYLDLERRYGLMTTEVASMEQAYRKTSAISKKKVLDLEAMEHRIGILVAEKAKADRRYYETQTSNLAKKTELNALRVQASRSHDVITQLKEIDTQNRALLSNLEKQSVELKKTNSGLAAEQRRMEVATADAARRLESVRVEAAELAGLVKTRDAAAAALRERGAVHEAEVERLRIRVEHVVKDRDSWRTKALNNSSEEEDMLRTFALCTVCRNNFKDTTLKTCGHLFCRGCVDRRIENRMRKCPTCARSFDKVDVMSVHH